MTRRNVIFGILFLFAVVWGGLVSTVPQQTLAQDETQKPTLAATSSSSTTALMGQIDSSKLEAITLANVGRLTAQARFGRGIFRTMVWSPDSKILAVGTTVGVWLYASDQLDGEPRFLPTQQSCVNQSSLLFSSDSRRLAAACPDGFVLVWDIDTSQTIATLWGYQDESKKADAPESIAFSLDGSQLAAGFAADGFPNGDGVVIVWDIKTGRKLMVLGGGRYEVDSVAFSLDTKLLAFGTANNTIRLWNLRTGSPGLEIAGHTAGVTSLAFSPDGKLLASGSDDQTVQLSNVHTGRVVATQKYPDMTLGSVSFLPDGRLVVSTSSDSAVGVWNVQSNEALVTVPHPGEGYTPSRWYKFSPDRKWLVLGANLPDLAGPVRVLDTASGQVVASLSYFSVMQRCLAVSPDGKFLIAGTDHRDGTKFDAAQIWDVQTGRIVAAFSNSGSPVYSTALSSDDKLLAAGSENGTVAIWNLESQQRVAFWQSVGDEIYAMAFSPDDNHLFFGGMDGQVRILDAQNGQIIATFNPYSDPHLGMEPVISVAISPDGKLLASGYAAPYANSDRQTYRSARVWDIQSGLSTMSFTFQDYNIVKGLAFSPDSKFLASGSFGTVSLWAVQNGKNTPVWDARAGGVSSVAFSPDGRLLVSGNDYYYSARLG